MTKYVAFLRAINVGGHAIIKMADLKRMFKSCRAGKRADLHPIWECHFRNRAKRISNVAGEADRESAGKAAGYKIHFFVRTMRELQSIVNKSPFKAKADEMAYVAFLNQKPDKKPASFAGIEK